MRFELKNNDQVFSSKIYSVIFISSVFSITLLLLSLTINLARISKSFEVNYLCKLFIVEKSGFNFKRLSKLTNQTSKQKMWELCKEITK